MKQCHVNFSFHVDKESSERFRLLPMVVGHGMLIPSEWLIDYLFIVDDSFLGFLSQIERRNPNNFILSVFPSICRRSQPFYLDTIGTI